MKVTINDETTINICGLTRNELSIKHDINLPDEIDSDLYLFLNHIQHVYYSIGFRDAKKIFTIRGTN